MARPTTTEAVVLRSFRFGEADRVLHLYTQARGRVGAVAKGVRKTKSRFGGRLEPFSHVELVLHHGRGELETVTGASLVRSHDAARTSPYRLQVGLIGLETMLRLFPEQEPNERAFTAVTRFLDVLDGLPPRTPARPEHDPLALAFQLKLLWLSGYLPALEQCVQCGAGGELVAFDPDAGGAVCRDCGPAGAGTIRLGPGTPRTVAALLRAPLVEASAVEVDDRAARDTLSLLGASYEHHGGFRLRTLAARG
jgi:DNA repair protein RecO (recombination protein O)